MSDANGTHGAGHHLDELAELYALGALEPHERARVEAHAAGCAECARALGTASATVAALDDAFVPRRDPPERLGARIAASADAAVVVPLPAHRTPRRPGVGRAAMAAAAALVIGIGGGALVERSADTQQSARDSAVLATIATSHFDHVTFTARDPRVPVTKVLYARDGAWLYVVVAGTGCDCRVRARSAAGTHDLGTPAVRGTTATLFVRPAARPDALELVDAAGDVLATAALVYAAR